MPFSLGTTTRFHPFSFLSTTFSPFSPILGYIFPYHTSNISYLLFNVSMKDVGLHARSS